MVEDYYERNLKKVFLGRYLFPVTTLLNIWSYKYSEIYGEYERSGGRAAVRNRGQRVGCDFAAEDKRSRPLNNALLLHFFTTMISVVGHACVARLWTG